MWYVVPAVSFLLLATGSSAQQPISCTGEAVSAIIQEVNATCSCCHAVGRCATRVIRKALAEGRLSRRCVGTVRRATATLCRQLRPACERLGGCLDTLSARCTGVPCRIGGDRCGVYNARCSAQCGSGGGDLRWRWTCGDPACHVGDEPLNGPPCGPEQAAGAPCTSRGVDCDPGNSCNALLVCSANELALRCPISRRAAKEGIDYLDDDAARQLHDELMRYPLATWRYRSAPDDRRHVGFIIDDVAPSASVAGDGEHVDLYGYTSMAVAALQVQEKEIASLRAELAALRRELEHRRPRRAR